jgi:hypothetical protein
MILLTTSEAALLRRYIESDGRIIDKHDDYESRVRIRRALNKVVSKLPDAEIHDDVDLANYAYTSRHGDL